MSTVLDDGLKKYSLNISPIDSAKFTCKPLRKYVQDDHININHLRIYSMCHSIHGGSYED